MATRPTGRRSRPRPSRTFWLLLTAWLLILVLAAGAVTALAFIYRGEQILAGVTALGRDLAGLTAQQAAARLEAEWADRRIALDAEGESWSLSPAQLGLVLDAPATARLAHRAGREELSSDRVLPLARRLLASTGLLPLPVEPAAVEPVWRFERARAVETLRTLAAQIDVPMQNAGVQVVDGRVETAPAVTGRSLDIAAVLAVLETHPWQQALARPTPPGRGTSPIIATFPLPISQHPPAVTDVSEVVAQVSPLLAAPITLRLYDPVRDERMSWTAQPAEMGRWIAFEIAEPGAGSAGAPAPGRLTWQVDAQRVAQWIAEQNGAFADERYVDPDDAAAALADALSRRAPEAAARISHGEREHTVVAGETLSSIAFDYGMPYPWLLAANPAAEEGLYVGDLLVIPSPDRLLPLPVVEHKRIVVSIARQRMQAFENGALVWDWPASTGMASSPTSPGVYQVQTHEPMAYAANWDLHMPWFMGIYRPVPSQEFMNGFHGFPSRDQRQLLWTNSLGHRVTYGCILVSTENAKRLYDWAQPGVVVEITR